MKVAFTICSNNYLAQAKTLGDSLLCHNPDYHFIICLVDKKINEIDYDFLEPYETIPVEDLQIPGFDELWKKYSIVELNTSVKASYFKYLIKKYPNTKSIFYFDPDIYFYSSLKLLEDELEENDVLLTPHIVTPIAIDNHSPSENLFLNYGIFNLGFIAVNSHSNITHNLLSWWEERALKVGFHNVAKGFYLDQLWINLVPIYFPSVKVIRQLGCNVAPWNLHERRLIQFTDGKYLMPDGTDLVFYHFSSYKFHTKNILAHDYSRYQFSNCSELVRQLYILYHTAVLDNRYFEFSNVSCYYQELRFLYISNSIKNRPLFYKFVSLLKKYLRQVLPPVLFSALKNIKVKYLERYE